VTVAFRRRRRESADEVDDDLDGIDEADDPFEDDEDVDAPVAPSRPAGPWDVDDVPDDGLTRLDLGSLQVPGLPGVEIQLNVDEASGTVAAVTAVHEGSALQLQAFAAARGEALWPQVRQELAAGITKDGGLADVDTADDGPTAGTVKARVPFPQPDGKMGLADVRFIGTDGPRWMLRGVLSGPAAGDATRAEVLLEVYRGVVVVRGGEAFAPSEPLPLRMPDQAGSAAPSAEPDRPDRTRLDPEGTGQRIAEIR
jgi:hypothetical protein